MVGLVIVAHSARLAEAVAELAAQMTAGQVTIALAGGLDQPGAPLGTDAVRVTWAIDEAWSNDGVLVLMDLGSAVLSAELALDLLPDDRRERVLLTEAPLVEGAVAAAVAARLGEPLERCAAEAREGLAGKVAQLGVTRAPAPPAARAGSGARTLRVVVPNALGLHARPAAALVRTAASFDAAVTVTDLTRGSGPATARSLNAVATLGARQGDELLIEATGGEAEAALAAIERLAADGFGEPAIMAGETAAAAAVGDTAGPARATGPGAPVASAPAPGTTLSGLAASPGIAIGRARLLRVGPLATLRPAADPATEWRTLQAALDAVGEDLRRARDRVAARAGDYDAAILDAEALFLADEALLGPTRRAVFERGAPAAAAWSDAVAAAVAAWDGLDDPYLRARAADLRGVGEQVGRRLAESGPSPTPVGVGGAAAAGEAAGGGGADEAGGGAGGGPPAARGRAGTIVVAPDLTPAETALLDPHATGGLACAFGGPTSHSAILARSLGIPAVVAVGEALLGVPDGAPLAIDGETGTIVVAPDDETVRALRERRARGERDRDAARALADHPAATSDGVAVRVEANVSDAGEAAAARATGADGVGLLRTEFLFLRGDRPPDEREQERSYRAVAEALGDRPLTLRTLDVGADKPLPWLPAAPERNPFLGVRGLRLGLRRPELLDEQLRAALRVAADHELRLLFPMVSTLDELLAARRLVERAAAGLRSEGVPGPNRLEVGIMVEVPAAALTAGTLAPHVDFFSVGTNDLAQYTLAAERGNPQVAALADPLHPAVLRLIELTARAAADAGRRVAVCGEAAGDPTAIPVLLGLGVTELSMAPPSVAQAKQTVRATSVTAARRLAQEALAAASAAEVRALVVASTGQ